MKRACERSNVDTKRFKERAILSAISHAKSELVSPEDVRADGARLLRRGRGARLRASTRSCWARTARSTSTTCIMRTVEMLREHEEIREKYQERFLHVLVDEFQDTNIAQYQLARLFAGEASEHLRRRRSRPVDLLVAVGGHPQHPQLRARLSGREDGAARAELPLDAEHPRRGARRHRGEQAAQGEVALDASRAAASRSSCTRRTTRRKRRTSSRTRSRRWSTEGDRPYGDFAVMYRTNAQSRALEEALIRAKVPYALVGGHAVLRAARGEGHPRVPAAGAEPVRRRELHARRERAGARHRREDDVRAGALGAGARACRCTPRCR